MWAYIYTYGKNEVCNPSKLSELLESGRGGIKNGKMGCLPLVCSQFNGFEVNPTLLAATSSRTLRNDAASSESTDPEGQQSSTPPYSSPFLTMKWPGGGAFHTSKIWIRFTHRNKVRRDWDNSSIKRHLAASQILLALIIMIFNHH